MEPGRSAIRPAGALNATRLLFLTDVPGVLDKNGQLIKELSVAQARELIKDGTISGGMIPKVEACLCALEAGAGKTHIIDGRLDHSLILEIFTSKGIGTQVVR